MIPDYGPHYNRKSGAYQAWRATLDEVAIYGVPGFLRHATQFILCSAAYHTVHPSQVFHAGRVPLNYLAHRASTERVVEIPWTLHCLSRYGNVRSRILEIGNVIQSYSDQPRIVVDKYEYGPGIKNTDVVDFVPVAPFDLVVSVSTLEHVGFNEEDKSSGKLIRALDHLERECLGPSGHAFITLPLGFNEAADRLILSKSARLGTIVLLERISVLNLWREVELSTILQDLASYRYGMRYQGATVVALCHFAATPAYE